MKIPNKIKILGYDYEVIFRNRGNDDGSDNAGTHSSRSQKIWIDSDQSQQQQESTFLHEILEALNYALQLEITHKGICSLEAGLYQVLKDNNLLK